MRCHRHLIHRGAIGTYYNDKNIIVFYIIIKVPRHSREARVRLPVGLAYNIEYSLIQLEFKRFVGLVISARLFCLPSVCSRPPRSEGPGGTGRWASPRKPPGGPADSLHHVALPYRWWEVGGGRWEARCQGWLQR